MNNFPKSHNLWGVELGFEFRQSDITTECSWWLCPLNLYSILIPWLPYSPPPPPRKGKENNNSNTIDVTQNDLVFLLVNVSFLTTKGRIVPSCSSWPMPCFCTKHSFLRGLVTAVCLVFPSSVLSKGHSPLPAKRPTYSVYKILAS